MPKYLLLIVEDEEPYAEGGEAEFNEVMEAHQAFAKEVAELGGTILGGEALQPLATATFLRGTRTDGVTSWTTRHPTSRRSSAATTSSRRPTTSTPARIAERCPAPYGGTSRCGRSGRSPARMPAEDSARAAAAAAEAQRHYWGRVVAATLRLARDVDIAEEATADAFVLALQTWPERGVPDSVEAWLLTAARRRAIDRIRRLARLRERLATLGATADVTGAAGRRSSSTPRRCSTTSCAWSCCAATRRWPPRRRSPSRCASAAACRRRRSPPRSSCRRRRWRPA